MAFDKDIPTAGTSLRASNPQILENQESIQEAVDNEHIFTGTDAGTQTGDHTQGSARCFSQADEPLTRIDEDNFLSTDLGSLWTDTDDNALYILTATTPTWTPVSDEVIATLLGSSRTFLNALSVAALFTALNNATVGGNLLAEGNCDVVGDMDPTSYDTANGGFKDQDDMSSNSDTAVASQQSIKAYTDLDSTGSVMHDAEGGFNNCDVNGTKAKVYTKYFTGTLDADASTSVAHGVTSGLTKILHVSANCFDDNLSIQLGAELFSGSSATTSFTVSFDGTNIIISNVGTVVQGNAYRIKIDYIL